MFITKHLQSKFLIIYNVLVVGKLVVDTKYFLQMKMLMDLFLEYGYHMYWQLKVFEVCVCLSICLSVCEFEIEKK